MLTHHLAATGIARPLLVVAALTADWEHAALLLHGEVVGGRGGAGGRGGGEGGRRLAECHCCGFAEGEGGFRCGILKVEVSNWEGGGCCGPGGEMWKDLY